MKKNKKDKFFSQDLTSNGSVWTTIDMAIYIFPRYAHIQTVSATSDTTQQAMVSETHWYLLKGLDNSDLAYWYKCWGIKFTKMLTVGLWIYVIIIGLLLFFAVLSNALVIYCVVTRKKLRSVTNVFICNLSVSDILLAGFVMPQRLHDISHTDAFYEGKLSEFLEPYNQLNEN